MAVPDATELLTETAALVKALTESSKAESEIAKNRADAEKTRAEADKVRAETESSRAQAETALASAKTDLETKQITNARSRADNEAARIDKYISQATGAVPDLASLPKSTVTFTQGTVLREGEAAALALDGIAGDIATAVIKATKRAARGSGSGSVATGHLYVASNANLLADVVLYRQIRLEAEALINQVRIAKEDAEEVVPRDPAKRWAGPAGTALVLGSLAGAVGKQIASLFEVDVAVTTNAADISVSSIQAAVVAKMLNSANRDLHNLTLHHEHARSLGSSPLLDSINTLIAGDIELAEWEARLDVGIEGLKNSASDLETAEKRLAGAKKAFERAKNVPEQEKAQIEIDEATSDAEAAHARLTMLKRLQWVKPGLTAVMEKTRAFAARLSSTQPSGITLLSTAIAVEAIATAAWSPPPPEAPEPPDPTKTSGGGGHEQPVEPWVLILRPGRVESSQIVVTRRIFWPRLHVSVALSLDYLLIRGDVLHAAGHLIKAGSYGAILAKDGPKWALVDAL